MKYAVNVIGYIETDYERSSSVMEQMLNRNGIKACFSPLNILDIVVQKMETEHNIPPEKVKRKRL